MLRVPLPGQLLHNNFSGLNLLINQSTGNAILEKSPSMVVPKYGSQASVKKQSSLPGALHLPVPERLRDMNSQLSHLGLHVLIS